MSRLARFFRPSILVALTGVPCLSAAATPAEIQAWLRDVDAVRQPYSEAVITVRQTEQQGGKVRNVDTFDVYVKGRERALVVFSQGKQKGRKILVDGEKMWLILPSAKRPIPISPGQRTMGAAALGEVAQFRAADDYDAVLREQTEEQGGVDCQVLDLTAKSEKSRYSRIELWVDTRHRPRKARFYLPSGKLAQELLFLRYEEHAGRSLLAEMEGHDLLAPKRALVIRLEYLKYRPAELDDALFTVEGARAVKQVSDTRP